METATSSNSAEETAEKYVYVVVYDSATQDFMVARKNFFRYFSFNEDSNSRNILPGGEQLIGGGHPVFPGTLFKQGEDMVNVALRKLEKTTTMRFQRNDYPIHKIKIVDSKKNRTFYGICINVGDSFKDFISTIKNSLKIGDEAATQIKGNGQFKRRNGKYKQAECPLDNEFQTVEVWNGKSTKGTEELEGIYYEIIRKLFGFNEQMKAGFGFSDITFITE